MMVGIALAAPMITSELRDSDGKTLHLYDSNPQDAFIFLAVVLTDCPSVCIRSVIRHRDIAATRTQRIFGRLWNGSKD